jgi:hypothetical protein
MCGKCCEVFPLGNMTEEQAEKEVLTRWPYINIVGRCTERHIRAKYWSDRRVLLFNCDMLNPAATENGHMVRKCRLLDCGMEKPFFCINYPQTGMDDIPIECSYRFSADIIEYPKRSTYKLMKRYAKRLRWPGPFTKIEHGLEESWARKVAVEDNCEEKAE